MSIFDVFRKVKSVPAPWEKYYSKEDLDIKIANISMYEAVKRSAIKYPDYKAIEYMGRGISYSSLIKTIDKCALSLSEMGITKGDIVTICMPNIPEALYVLYGLNKIGAIANMIHPLSAENEILQSLTSTNSVSLFICDMFYDKIENTIYDTNVDKVVLVSPSDSLGLFLKIGYKIKTHGKYKKYPKSKKFLNLRQFLKLGRGKKETVSGHFGKNTPAVILHSGGTSGTPKNVVIQNRAFYLGAKQTGEICLHLKPGDSCLAIMPNFHGFGLSVCMHTALTLGCYTTLVPQFDASKFDELFDKTKPTIVLGVPTLFEALIKCNNVKNLDLSGLKYVISGGDTLTANLENSINKYLKEHHSNAKITQGYGLSEALAAVTLGFGDVNKSGSIGIPLPGNYIKIINPSNRKTLPYGETGEIVINSRAFMLGYLNNESDTNEALQIHDDGRIWLHTGDLGYMDEDGFIFYQGRSKRMIITSGYNVYPSHVEEVIESHPDVLQCTVVGVPHPYKQEVGKAFIVLKEGKHSLLVKNDIKNYCKKNLAKYMVPYIFVFRKQLPKTKLGKVDFVKLQSDIGVDDDEE